MKRRYTEESWRKEPWLKGLVQAFLSCKSDEQMANFLRDIATLSELAAMSERLEVARLLGKGLSYRQVSKMTGASTTTVTRVAQFLENGQGGYREFLKVHRHHDQRKKRALTEEENEEITNKEQKFNTKTGEDTYIEAKNDISSRKTSPLQKYLQK